MNPSLLLLCSYAVKTTVLLVSAFVLSFAMRRGSSARKELLWTSILVALVILPVLKCITPPIPIALLTPPKPRLYSTSFQAAPQPVLSTATKPALQASISRPYFAWGWILGIFGCAGYFALGCATLRRWRRNAHFAQGSEAFTDICAEAGIGRAVQFLESDQCDIPVTWGWLRPVILLPAKAAMWPASLRRNVLLHELAHVRRADWLFRFLVHAACAIYWWNPLIWIAARRWRAACEEVCDDFVTAHGARRSEYARDLLSIARAALTVDRLLSAAFAMISTVSLDHRIRSILDKSGDQKPVPSSTRVALCIGVTIICAFVAGMTLTQAHGSGLGLTGIVIPKLDFDKLTVSEAIEALRNAGRGVLPPETDFSITYRGADLPRSRGSLHLEECPLPDVLEALAGVFHLSLEYTTTGVILSEKVRGLNLLHASAEIPPHLAAAKTDSALAATGNSPVRSAAPTPDGSGGYLNNKAVAADATASLGEVIPSTAHQGKPSTAFAPIEIKADHTWYENGVASAQGHASLTQGNDKLVADTIRYTSETHDLVGTGNFSFTRGDETTSGLGEHSSVRVNLETGRMEVHGPHKVTLKEN